MTTGYGPVLPVVFGYMIGTENVMVLLSERPAVMRRVLFFDNVELNIGGLCGFRPSSYFSKSPWELSVG